MLGYKHNLEIDTSENLIDAKAAYGPIISMAKRELPLKVGAAIRTARKRRGLVQRNIAEFLGIEVAAVGMWESGKNMPSAENSFRVAAFLNIDPVALSRGEVAYLKDDGLADAEIISDPAPLDAGPKDVEMLGVTYGGDDGDFQFNGEVTEYVRRPPGIANVKNVFALYVLSDSMAPRYEPGEVIYCGTREPIPGDYVVIEMHPEIEGQPGKAFIKRLKQRTGKEIIVEQFNPPKLIPFDRYTVKNIWRVIPNKELFGF